MAQPSPILTGFPDFGSLQDDLDDHPYSKNNDVLWSAPLHGKKNQQKNRLRCIWLLSVFRRPVRAPGLQRMEIAGVGRVPPRGANSIPTDNLQMH